MLKAQDMGSVEVTFICSLISCRVGGCHLPMHPQDTESSDFFPIRTLVQVDQSPIL